MQFYELSIGSLNFQISILMSKRWLGENILQLPRCDYHSFSFQAESIPLFQLYSNITQLLLLIDNTAWRERDQLGKSGWPRNIDKLDGLLMSPMT